MDLNEKAAVQKLVDAADAVSASWGDGWLGEIQDPDTQAELNALDTTAEEVKKWLAR